MKLPSTKNWKGIIDLPQVTNVHNQTSLKQLDTQVLQNYRTFNKQPKQEDCFLDIMLLPL